MATDRTEQLIVGLVADLVPVRRLPATSVRLGPWVTVAMGSTVAAAWVIGVRPDLLRALAAPDVLWSLGLASLASASSAVMALRLSVPGVQSRWARWLPVAIAAVWVSVLAEASRAAGVSTAALVREPFHAACVARIVVIALMPTFILMQSVRRGFALDPVWAAALATLGGGTLAAVAVQLACPIDRPAHVLMSHAVPALGLMLAGAAASRVLPRVIRSLPD